MNYKMYQEYVNKAVLEYKNQNLETSLKYLLEAEKIYADPDLLIDIALLYDELDDYDFAKTYYQKVLDLDINNARAYYGLATIYDNLTQYDEAKAYYKEAISLDDHYFEAHFFLANIYDDESETNLAIYHYKRVIELNPEYFYAYLNLGALYENLNQNEVGLDYLLKAETINQNNHLLYFNLGVVYRKLNNIEKSIECYYKSLDVSTTHAYTFLNLAIIYKDDLKDLKKAIEIYTVGITLHDQVAVLYYNRGCAYALQDEYEKAISDLLDAISLEKSIKEYMYKDEELADLRRSQIFCKTFSIN